ncbi:hypothetical protein EB118_18295 [bacterium]|nr:hypothetical protein [bacterium]NDC95732.1 hypothetical protein [bacterium]NDD85354.1 hypothetical protein [bacterium]NDG32011.1 hypothetical protein [bacterium]
MPSYDQVPGKLNLSFRAGDYVSTEIDFNPISLTGSTMSATISSLVGGGSVAAITTTLTNAAAGKVNISLTALQTLSLPRGTYRWDLTGLQAGNARQSYLTGFVEVIS